MNLRRNKFLIRMRGVLQSMAQVQIGGDFHLGRDEARLICDSLMSARLWLRCQRNGGGQFSDFVPQDFPELEGRSSELVQAAAIYHAVAELHARACASPQDLNKAQAAALTIASILQDAHILN